METAPKKSPISLNLALSIITGVSLLICVFLIVQNWFLNQKLQKLIEAQKIAVAQKIIPVDLGSTITPTATITRSPLNTYTNLKYKFTFQYPNYLDLFQESDMDKITNLTMIPICDLTSIACLYFKEDQYPNTNFRGAGLSINTRTKALSSASCDLEMVPGGRNTGSKTINFTSYRTFTTGGAAAGNQNQDSIYLTFKNNTCFEIIGRIVTDSSDVNSEPAGSIKTFTSKDQTDLIDQFDQILSTLTFTKKAI